MSSQPHAMHPVLSALDALQRAVKDVADIDPVFMTVADKKAALLTWASLRGQVEELGMRVLVSAEDLAEEEGMRDPAAWFAHHARIDRGEARRLLALGRRFEGSCAATGRAVREGEVSIAQAGVITRAMEQLSTDLEPDLRGLAEAQLVVAAARFEPRRLRVLGRKILEVVAPEVAEGREARLLEREEQAARRHTYLQLRQLGDGTTVGQFRIPDLAGHRLTTYLDAYTNPRHPDGTPLPGPSEDRRPYEEKLGAAFCSLLEAVDPKRLPLHGGDATTMMVTIDLDTLRGRLGEAGVALVGDEPISAAEARRLACTATIIPAVLDGTSRVLDLGRAKRLYEGYQRKAEAIRHPTCRARGCEVPATWCEAHHGGLTWGEGGGTDQEDLLLLCPFHHQRAHDPRYEMTRHPDGSVRFHKRT